MLALRVCCGGVAGSAKADGAVLERGVRGKNDNLANARDAASMLGEEGTEGELERNPRLIVLNDGVREFLCALCERGGRGVTGSLKLNMHQAHSEDINGAKIGVPHAFVQIGSLECHRLQ